MDRYCLKRRWPGEQGLFTLVWERWRFSKASRPGSLRVQGATSDSEEARRQASRGGHYEHPETQKPAFINIQVPERRLPKHTQDRKQRRGHRQRRQQTSPAATSPSPRGAHWGAQERRGRWWSRVEHSSALGVKQSERLASFLALALSVSAIWART